MKAINELIEKHTTLMNTQVTGSIGWLNHGRFIEDLETLKEKLNTNVITDNSKVNENLLEENRQLKEQHKKKLKALRKKHKENISDCYDNALDSFVIFTEQQKRD